MLHRQRTFSGGFLPSIGSTWFDRFGHTVMVPRRRTLSLRSRVTLYFSLTALVASVALTVVTYLLARNYLIDQRTTVAQRQAFVNARAIRDSLRVPNVDIIELIDSARTEDEGFALLRLADRGRAAPSNISRPESVYPASLLEQVASGRSGWQRFTVDGRPYLAVGVSIPEVNAEYFEAFPLKTTDRTLWIIASTLAAGAGATTLMAAGLGAWISRRLLRPLSRVAAAAGDIAGGGLNTRLAEETDPELDRLARSFNEMADAVQSRIEREVRFASDVSHELRSPVTALSAAVEVLDGRRAELPPRSQQALDVVVSQVRRFDQLVLDLLELSRLDAGAGDLHREPLVLPDVVPRIAARYGHPELPLTVGAGGKRIVPVDKRRLERIVANLLDNADQHGGGPTRIVIEGVDRVDVTLAVEDAGPGVARGEQDRIFERFARGTAARNRIGTGLGLALVTEHARSHGGRAWVEDRPGGGARFVVLFPGGEA